MNLLLLTVRSMIESMTSQSGHFEDFAPVLWAQPPPTYPDAPAEGPGRWIVTDAGILWTNDQSLLGLDTTNASDWTLVTNIRATLVEQFALGTPAAETFGRIQEELDVDEWFDGDLEAADITV